MPFVANPVQGLSLDGLVFVENGQPKVYTDAPSGETYSFDVLDPDTQWGNPEPVTAVLLSLMTNGSHVAYLHDDNREPSIALTVKASGASALSAAESALRAVTYKTAELIWQPPSASSAPTVFDIVFSRLDHRMDSLGERWFRRSYSIRLQALPHARSADLIVTPAVTTAAPTVVDNGSATTNWTAPYPAGATVSVVSGAVTSTYDPDAPFGANYGTRLRRAFPAPLDVSVNKFIAVDWKSSLSSVYALIPNAIPFGNLSEVRREPAPAAGFTRSWYSIAADMTSLTEFTFDIIHPANAAASATLSIDQVLSANALPAQGTGRQKSAVIFPGGSVPAEGDIILQHPTASLGRSIIFTHPVHKGYSPPLRPWRTSGGAVTANAGMVSGAYDDVTAPEVFSVPIDTLPRGSAQIWAKMGASSTSAAQLNWSVTSWQGGVAQTTSRQSGNVLVQVPSVGPHYLFPIARVTLPPSTVSGPNGYVVFIIDKDASSAGISMTLDEVWVFAMDEGTLTVIDAGDGAVASGLNANRARISAASIDEPFGALRVATAADWSDQWTPAGTNVLCDQRNHRFDPAGSMVFAVTSNALDTAVSFEHYPRWHTHAGS